MSDESVDKPVELPHTRSSLRTRRIVGGIAGTVLLGALGSGLWDLLFRPSLRETGGWLSQVWQAVDDAVFASAALDPRPIPDLVFIIILLNVPLWIATGALLNVFVRPSLHKRFLDRARDYADYRRDLLKRVRWMVLGSVAFLLVVYALGRVGLMMANESVLVWRIFHRNLAISAPYLTPEQMEQFSAGFAKMRSRSDFDALRSQIDATVQREITLSWLR